MQSDRSQAGCGPQASESGAGEYLGGPTFHEPEPRAGGWEEPEAGPQQASLAVIVGSRRPNLLELDLVKSPSFLQPMLSAPLCCLWHPPPLP